MGTSRRQLLQMAGGSLALVAATRIASAQTYPARPVRIVVGFPPGGPNDITARIVAQWLSERLGQQFIVENRPGAGSNLATEYVVRAPADGYTLLLVPPPAAINTTLYGKLNFTFLRDIDPVAGIVRVPEVMVINPSLPVDNAREFIAFAKARPGKINMGSSGNGTMPHIAGELFKVMAGVDLVRIGYRGGGPALVDLMAGQLQVMFEPTLATLPYIRAQRLRALAVTSATPSTVLPDVPVLADTVPGYEATAWYGIGAPKNTPTDIVARLNQEINAGLADAKLRGRLADLGGDPMPMMPAEFGKLVADETEKWGKLIRAANIRLDGD
ncbi:MAG TPA: tripartite tricarboxylate transporter substrate binding protein [Xanthobacteraceae bacterium]|nr:tripartite tricarboxylate transporter substrate binding protein [Xanthobacteraceae bacterium]